MNRVFIVVVWAVVWLTLGAGVASAEEDVSIRGNFPQLLARGETTPQMANRIAVALINLDRLIAPPCGMKRVFTFSGADYVDEGDLGARVDPAKPGVWRFVVIGHGCWTNRVHNVFVYPRGTNPAALRAGVPGRSVAGPKYQGEALQLVFREANAIAIRSNCDEGAFISDTNVTKVRRPGQPWEEVWMATACEVTRKFLVMFTPDGQKMRLAVVLND